MIALARTSIRHPRRAHDRDDGRPDTRVMSAWSTGAPDAAMVVASVARSERAMATGTAAVMAAVAVPFAFSDLINVRQFGIGIAVAVLGRRAWWPTASRRAPAGGRTSRLHPRVPGGTT